MEISSLSTPISTESIGLTVGYTMLAKQMDQAEQDGTALVKMMEQSVTPSLGQNIDIQI